MDQAIVDAIGGDPTTSRAKTVNKSIRIAEDRSHIEIDTAQGPREFTLRPLAELYGPGTGRESVDPQDEVFAPLFLAIEQTIVLYLRAHPSMQDAEALLALERLSINPDCDPGPDVLTREIQ